MRSSEIHRPEGRRRKLRLWHIGVALPCVMLAGVLSLRYHWRAEFHRRVEAIRAAGLPVTWQELDVWYEGPPTGQNPANRVLWADDCCLKLLSHMVRMWGAVYAAWALERALCHVEFTDGQLAKLHQAFGGIEEGDSLRRALVGDRCLWLPAFENPASLDPRSFDRLPPAAVLEVYGGLGLSAREGAAFLDYAEECLRSAGLSGFQRLDTIKSVEARYLYRRGMPLLSKIGTMSGHVRREATPVAWLETAMTALAVERHRLGRGRLPDALGQLVPDYLAAVPEDPFDGRPLRYRRTDRGFVVYSVGEDGRDDGGKPRRPVARGKPHAAASDLTFRVER